jgi:hypothetical protein
MRSNLSHPTRGKFYRRQRGNPDDCGLRISCPCSGSGFSQTQRTNLAATGGNAKTSCPPSPLRVLQRCVQVLPSSEDRNPTLLGPACPIYFQPGQDRSLAKVDLQPRFLRWRGSRSRRVAIVHCEPGSAAAGGCFRTALGSLMDLFSVPRALAALVTATATRLQPTRT